MRTEKATPMAIVVVEHSPHKLLVFTSMMDPTLKATGMKEHN
jgi:hypothetical protein